MSLRLWVFWSGEEGEDCVIKMIDTFNVFNKIKTKYVYMNINLNIIIFTFDYKLI